MLKGTVSGEDLSDIIYGSGIFDFISTTDTVYYLVPDIDENLGAANLTIWISNESVLPVRYQMDLSRSCRNCPAVF